jgi:hypothetical protein
MKNFTFAVAALLASTSAIRVKELW